LNKFLKCFDAANRWLYLCRELAQPNYYGGVFITDDKEVDEFVKSVKDSNVRVSKKLIYQMAQDN
jgi:hypothetical protein